MAYLIFTTLSGRELSRETLAKAPTVIGRSPECELCVHDILLSRRHCRLEEQGEQWFVVDLASKNGTFLDDQEIGRHQLSDRETVRMGKTLVIFRSGSLQNAPSGGAAYHKPNKPRQRPADPWAAMHDTMTGFDFLKSLKSEKSGFATDPLPTPAAEKAFHSRLPTPQPKPSDPGSYEADDIYGLLSGLTSSAWDSIHMTTWRPVTAPAGKGVTVSRRHPRRRPASPMSLTKVPPPIPMALRQRSLRKTGWWQRGAKQMAKGFATLAQMVFLMGILHVLH